MPPETEIEIANAQDQTMVSKEISISLIITAFAMTPFPIKPTETANAVLLRVLLKLRFPESLVLLRDPLLPLRLASVPVSEAKPIVLTVFVQEVISNFQECST